jgi:hypothetical protein
MKERKKDLTAIKTSKYMASVRKCVFFNVFWGSFNFKKSSAQLAVNHA